MLASSLCFQYCMPNVQRRLKAVVAFVCDLTSSSRLIYMLLDREKGQYSPSFQGFDGHIRQATVQQLQNKPNVQCMQTSLLESEHMDKHRTCWATKMTDSCLHGSVHCVCTTGLFCLNSSAMSALQWCGTQVWTQHFFFVMWYLICNNEGGLLLWTPHTGFLGVCIESDTADTAVDVQNMCCLMAS